MLAKDLISQFIPPIRTSDLGSKALLWMNEFKVTHLPIVNNLEFLGLISEADIIDLNLPNEAIGNHALSLTKSYVFEDQHLYDVISIINQQKLTIVPVLDKDENYLGLITMGDLVQNLASMASIADPGSIIVLELNQNSFHLSEAAHIVEQNEAVILSSYVTSYRDSTRVELTLKVNLSDPKRILAAFERFGYKVTASYTSSDTFDDIKNRYDSLMNYLNM